MRIIARHVLVEFWTRHPDARHSLAAWEQVARRSDWASTGDVQQAFSKAKVLNAERIRFEVAGGRYRLIAAFDFPRRIVFLKFLGTHAEYDRVDAFTVSLF